MILVKTLAALGGCGHNASGYEFLVLICEFDIRQSWKAWNLGSCTEWLNFKCGMSLGTAREKVRVAMGVAGCMVISRF